MVKSLVPSALRTLGLSHEGDTNDVLWMEKTLAGPVETFAIAKEARCTTSPLSHNWCRARHRLIELNLLVVDWTSLRYSSRHQGVEVGAGFQPWRPWQYLIESADA